MGYCTPENQQQQQQEIKQWQLNRNEVKELTAATVCKHKQADNSPVYGLNPYLVLATDNEHRTVVVVLCCVVLPTWNKKKRKCT